MQSVTQHEQNLQRPSVAGSRDLFTFDGELLHSTPLSSAAVGGQAEAADAAACSDSGAQDVVGVEVITTLKRRRTHVSFCSVPLLQSAMLTGLRYLQVVWVEVGLVLV